jgi:hypothetical protein
VANGGADNGAPGLRPDYGDFYYAAFVVDPDGHRIEAVTKALMEQETIDSDALRRIIDETGISGEDNGLLLRPNDSVYHRQKRK